MTFPFVGACDLEAEHHPALDVLGGIAGKLTRRPVILSERSSAECYPPGLKTTLLSTIAALPWPVGTEAAVTVST